CPCKRGDPQRREHSDTDRALSRTTGADSTSGGVSMARTENGKVALVVGAGQGIGRAAAERLHRDGFRVAIGDFNNDTANEVAEALGGKDAGAVAVYVNATDRDSVFAAVDETVTELGGFDVIINNAGIAPQVAVEDATEEDFDTIFGL